MVTHGAQGQLCSSDVSSPCPVAPASPIRKRSRGRSGELCHEWVHARAVPKYQANSVSNNTNASSRPSTTRNKGVDSHRRSVGSRFVGQNRPPLELAGKIVDGKSQQARLSPVASILTAKFCLGISGLS